MPSGAKTNVKKYENRHESFMRGQFMIFYKRISESYLTKNNSYALDIEYRLILLEQS